MKPISILSICFLMLCAAVAQDPASPATQTPPAASAAQSAAAPQTAPAETPRKVAAKTKPEFDAYNAAELAIKTDPDAAKGETAAMDFAAKFPQSELTSILYQELMARFQRADDAPKAIEWGRKVIAIDPDAVLALITVATTLAETSNETDLDFEQRYDEVVKDANRAVQLIDSGAYKPPIPPEQLKAVEATAYSAVGSIEFTRAGDTRVPAAEQVRHDALAEEALRKATELNTMSPEPSIWLRYAITLDHEKKYDQALVAANRAAELAADNATVLALASQEQTRLKELTSSAAPATPAQKPPQ